MEKRQTYLLAKPATQLKKNRKQKKADKKPPDNIIINEMQHTLEFLYCSSAGRAVAAMRDFPILILLEFVCPLIQ
jgi:hypothetical protein